ncbi:cytochrome P450 [Nocardia higoensis]|uniref:Cytochrome P450 n=1 Tax=Nocardia higoensis TaxID=228599 RepID=A0ABS0D6D2_9NOCA|nr:cytochrome P450 [Nocardia higoensis]MBF6354036.1 cytochrome P450 [Nocardia higoensis]
MGRGSPHDADNDFRVPIYTEQFAADPHAAYAHMREQFGSLAPIWLAPGVPATLVIGYWTALRILHDPEHFPADPRVWQRGIPPECPVRPMMQWRPNALRSSGFEHARYRSATVDALARVELHRTRQVVERIAVVLIGGFCSSGRADLIRDFASPLVFEVISELLGCDPDISGRAATGMAMIFDTTDVAAGNELMVAALAELVRRKRARPGEDITSRLLAHPTALTDEEAVHQLVTLYGAASEPLTNLIVNTVSWMMTHPDFGGEVVGGAMSTRDGLTHVLFRDPPIANFCMSYPRQPQLVDGVWVPAHRPVVISLAACNNDPAVVGGNIRGNESHLGLGAGPHRCPARALAELIAGEAIDQLLDVLPEMTPAVPHERLRWRPGPFHRALEELPVLFTPVPPPTVSR